MGGRKRIRYIAIGGGEYAICYRYSRHDVRRWISSIGADGGGMTGCGVGI